MLMSENPQCKAEVTDGKGRSRVMRNCSYLHNFPSNLRLLEIEGLKSDDVNFKTYAGMDWDTTWT